MNDRQRWLISVFGALLLYASLFFAAVLSMPDGSPFSPAVAVELRLPSLSADGGSVRRPHRQPQPAAEKSDRQNTPKSEIPTEALPAAAEKTVPLRLRSETSAEPVQTADRTEDRPNRDEGPVLPQIDFITAGAGVVLPMPGYPAAARRKGIEGTVTIRVTVAADGTVSETEILTCSHEWFRRAVLSVVREWRFPPQGNGFVTEKQFVFRLKDSK